MNEHYVHRPINVILWVVLFAACTSCASPTPRTTGEPVQLLTPTVPEGAILCDQCAYMLSYPLDLATDDGMLFQAPDDESVSVLINARRRTDPERDVSLNRLATQISVQWGAPSTAPAFESVKVIDYAGQTLDGIRADFINDEGQHIRLMIVVRPQTMLGDQLPDDVVYEIVAQAPEETWPEWASSFEIIFQTFHPKDCGGV